MCPYLTCDVSLNKIVFKERYLRRINKVRVARGNMLFLLETRCILTSFKLNKITVRERLFIIYYLTI